MILTIYREREEKSQMQNHIRKLEKELDRERNRRVRFYFWRCLFYMYLVNKKSLALTLNWFYNIATSLLIQNKLLDRNVLNGNINVLSIVKTIISWTWCWKQGIVSLISEPLFHPTILINLSGKIYHDETVKQKIIRNTKSSNISILLKPPVLT